MPLTKSAVNDLKDLVAWQVAMDLAERVYPAYAGDSGSEVWSKSHVPYPMSYVRRSARPVISLAPR
jgi:hypothetical protein